MFLHSFLFYSSFLPWPVSHHETVYLSVCLSVCLPVCLSAHQSVFQVSHSVCQSVITPSANQCVIQSVFLYVRLSD